MTPLKRASSRLEGLRADRQSWKAHWEEIARFILPRRHRWFITPGQSNRGSPINQNIKDPTGTIAARNLAAGLMAGKTSPARPWFKLRAQGAETSGPVAIWLAEVEKRMMRVFQESNFYDSLAVFYLDLVTFGTGPVLIYEDYDDVIRCFNPAAGEYFIGVDDRNVVNTFAREFTQTIQQVVKWFGIENCSDQVKNLYNGPNGPSNFHQEIVVGHLIEPNWSGSGVSTRFKFVETYWEVGRPTEGEGSRVLAQRGFHEFPGFCARWSVTGNDAYGHSPAMDALPDIKQLQHETLRKAQAIDKTINPPMKADVQLKNQPTSLLPGGITYVSGLNAGASAGIAPIYQIQPNLNDLKEDIMEVQNRIRTTFHNDLFLMISQLDTVRTATEIDARREEKLVMLGPVLERIDNEGLDEAIDRVFAIMSRGGLLPPAPAELQGKGLQIEYVSMLATAQHATATTAIERLAAMAGTIAQGQASVNQIPDAWDNIDSDAVVQEYGAQLGVPPKLLRDKKAKEGIRKARMEGMQGQTALDQTGQAVEAAQGLSKTDVGGGRNALQLITGGIA